MRKGSKSSSGGKVAGAMISIDLFDKNAGVSVRSTRLCCQGPLFCEKFNFAAVKINEEYTRITSSIEKLAEIQQKECARKAELEHSILYKTSQ